MIIVQLHYRQQQKRTTTTTPSRICTSFIVSFVEYHFTCFVGLAGCLTAWLAGYFEKFPQILGIQQIVAEYLCFSCWHCNWLADAPTDSLTDDDWFGHLTFPMVLLSLLCLTDSLYLSLSFSLCESNKCILVCHTQVLMFGWTVQILLDICYCFCCISL